MSNDLTICFPITRGPQSFYARLLCMSIRKFLPENVRIIAFQVPGGVPLSSETIDLFDWLDVDIKTMSPTFYFRHPEDVFKYVDITSFEFNSRFVLLLDPKCIFLREVNIFNLTNGVVEFMAPACHKKDLVDDDIMTAARGISRSGDLSNINDSGQVIGQYCQSAILYESNGNFPNLWRKITGRVYNSGLGLKVKDNAPRIALQLTISEMRNKFIELPEGWGVFPHRMRDAILLRYEKVNAIFAKKIIRDIVIDFEKMADEAGCSVINELTVADMRFLGR